MMLMSDFLRDFCTSIYSFFHSLLSSRLKITFPNSQLSVVVVGRKNQSIGEGAFSSVYHVADCNHPKRFYALKRMLLQSSDLASMARAEIDAYKRFAHANIIKLIDHAERVESNKAVIYMLLPYCSRGSMRDELNSMLSGSIQKPALAKVLDRFADICRAIQVLHSYQPSYVHFDIKPENILLDDTGKALVTDFGSVRRAERAINDRKDVLSIADEASEFCTASYRAPELYDPIKGTTLDCRTDVWALGCLLFAAWFGYSPFECQFMHNTNKVQVVECSALRVLADIPNPIGKNVSADDLVICKLTEEILQKQLQKRMFIPDILLRIDNYNNESAV